MTNGLFITDQKLLGEESMRLLLRKKSEKELYRDKVKRMLEELQ